LSLWTNISDIEKVFRRLVIVDHCTTFIKDDIFYCCVEVRHLYKPQQGDKFASHYAQKDVINSVLPEEVMPQTDHGVISYIIVNPHAFPSRMAVGHLIETYICKCIAMDPERFGTSFVLISKVMVWKILKQNFSKVISLF